MEHKQFLRHAGYFTLSRPAEVLAWVRVARRQVVERRFELVGELLPLLLILLFESKASDLAASAVLTAPCL